MRTGENQTCTQVLSLNHDIDLLHITATFQLSRDCLCLWSLRSVMKFLVRAQRTRVTATTNQRPPNVPIANQRFHCDLGLTHCTTQPSEGDIYVIFGNHVTRCFQQISLHAERGINYSINNLSSSYLLYIQNRNADLYMYMIM